MFFWGNFPLLKGSDYLPGRAALWRSSENCSLDFMQDRCDAVGNSSEMASRAREPKFTGAFISNSAKQPERNGRISEAARGRFSYSANTTNLLALAVTTDNVSDHPAELRSQHPVFTSERNAVASMSIFICELLKVSRRGV